MLNFSARVSTLTAALALGACAAGPASDEPPAANVKLAQGGPNCPTVLCGDNNGVGNVRFYELDASMAMANGAGLRITNFVSPKHGPMELKVKGDRLLGRPQSHAELEGEGLVGSWITLVDDKAGTSGRIVIEGYDTIDYKIAPDPGDRVPLYKFIYYPDGREGAPMELCRNTLTDPDYGGIMGSAIIFSGDRYDPQTLQVTDIGDDAPWFNIGCPGTGAMKMHLFRHTRAGAKGGSHHTKVAQRQALLKMFGADYCGTGRNFTVDGQPIAFNFDQDWLPTNWGIDFTSPDYTAPEAIWREDGAYCLSTPRRAGATPNVEVDILAECDAAQHKVPQCTNEELENWRKHGYAVTMNPAPPPP